MFLFLYETVDYHDSRITVCILDVSITVRGIVVEILLLREACGLGFFKLHRKTEFWLWLQFPRNHQEVWGEIRHCVPTKLPQASCLLSQVKWLNADESLSTILESIQLVGYPHVQECYERWNNVVVKPV